MSDVFFTQNNKVNNLKVVKTYSWGDLAVQVNWYSSIYFSGYSKTKFLNFLELINVPSHRPKLKVGICNMVLSNLNPVKFWNALSSSFFHNSSSEIYKKMDMLIARVFIIPVDLCFEITCLQLHWSSVTINHNLTSSWPVLRLDLQTFFMLIPSRRSTDVCISRRLVKLRGQLHLFWFTH